MFGKWPESELMQEVAVRVAAMQLTKSNNWRTLRRLKREGKKIKRATARALASPNLGTRCGKRFGKKRGFSEGEAEDGKPTASERRCVSCSHYRVHTFTRPPSHS